ncbi:MAG: hypothetical protein R6U58_09360 [Bacteroidales bacterium]
MKQLCIFRVVLLFGIMVITSGTYAQVERVVLPGELRHETIVTEPPTLRKGFLRAGLVYSHSFVDKIFDANNNRTGLGGTISGQSRLYQIHAMYGLTNRLELYASIPFVNVSLYQTTEYHMQNSVHVNRWSQHGKGLSDISLGLRYLLLEESASLPSLFVGVTSDLPTGEKNPTNIIDENNFDRPTGSGEYAFDFEMKARKVIYPWSFSIYASHKIRTGGEKIVVPGQQAVSFKDGNYTRITGSGYFHLNDWIVLANDLSYGIRGRDMVDDVPDDNKSWNIDLTPYLFFQIRQMRLAQSVTIPMKGHVAGADPMYILIVQLIL